MNEQQFATSVLQGLGVKPNAENVRAMTGWMRAEGGHWHNTAKYNPLNTTQNMPGSGDTGSQGNISVYNSWQQGVQATVKTLQNGRYGGIIHALKSGKATDVAQAIGASPWGTPGSLVTKTIAGTPPSNIRESLAPYKTGPGAVSNTVETSTPKNLVSRLNSAAAAQPADPTGSGAAISGMLQKAFPQGKELLKIAFAPSPALAVPVQKARSLAVPGSSIAAPGSAPDDVRSMIERANKIDAKRYPYVWGGGHAQSGKADRGTGRDPGIGFDCSGAVSAVLGVDPRVSGQFAQWGKPGRAKGGRGVTVYANGHHVLMEINGHFFGTSGTNPQGGAGWIPSSAISSSYLAGFTARHL